MAKSSGAALEDGGGMFGSAFSSPILATLGGRRQLVVQTRQQLAGLDPGKGTVLWSHNVPAFRGMNILTPLVVADSVFTSSYQNRAWLYRVGVGGEQWKVAEAWSNNAQGYMSSPVLVNDHVYLHLQNQCFTCIDLKTGERRWTSKPFGKYCSLVANGDRILALDQRGELLLFRADPKQFELIDSVKVSDAETWRTSRSVAT